jgi:hypothetical protein
VVGSQLVLDVTPNDAAIFLAFGNILTFFLVSVVFFTLIGGKLFKSTDYLSLKRCWLANWLPLLLIIPSLIFPYSAWVMPVGILFYQSDFA